MLNNKCSVVRTASSKRGRQRHWNIGWGVAGRAPKTRESRRRRRRAGWDLGRGCVPSQKIYEFFISKWCDMVHSGCVVFKIHVSHGLYLYDKLYRSTSLCLIGGSSTQDVPCRSNIGGGLRPLQPLRRWRLCVYCVELETSLSVLSQ